MMAESDFTLSLPNATLYDSDQMSSYKATNSNYRITSCVIAWLILLLCILGVVGNTFSIIIYCSPSMRSPINVLLAGLSFIDLSLSLFSVPTFVIPGLYAYYGTPLLRMIMAYVAVYIYPIALTMQTASVWTFVLITVERWQTVARRSKGRLSVERARVALGLVCILATAYNAVRFFEFRLVYGDSRSLSTLESIDSNAIGPKADQGVSVAAVFRNSTAYPVYMNVYYVGMFLITHFAVPFTILVILNGLIVATICRSRRRRILLNRRERSEHRTATMIIIVVATFIICYTLLFSLNIIEAVDAEWFYDARHVALAFALNDLSNLLVVANSSTTIFVYYFFSSKYRYMLVGLLDRTFPCLHLESFLAMRKQSIQLEDEILLNGNQRLSASAGMHALFMVVARTGDSKRSFLIRKRRSNPSPVKHDHGGCIV